jgi:hypothetical protein
MTIVGDFLSKVQAVHKTGAATEHSYRSALETLFSALDDSVNALNEPKRVACGAPDFIIQRGEIVIGHVEAKDLHLDLRAMKDTNKAQQQRYLKALPNLIYTIRVISSFWCRALTRCQPMRSGRVSLVRLFADVARVFARRSQRRDVLAGAEGMANA